MIVRATPDNLPDEIAALLEESGSEIKKAVNEAIKEVAEEASEDLKRGRPYKERTGKYTKSWIAEKRTSKVSAVTGTDEYSVHNKKYQLTHLLENGHASRNGGRVRAYEHIGPEEKETAQRLTERIAEKVES